MIATIVVSALVGAWFLVNLRRMIRNVRAGRSVDGCSGDCAHCGSCPHRNR